MFLSCCLLLGLLSRFGTANANQTCEVIGGDHRICTESSVLVSVAEWNETNDVKNYTKKLSLILSNVSKITPNAFKNLKITELSINLMGEKLLLEPEAFQGLRWLKSLRVSNGKISLKKNIFKALTSLESLELSADQSQEPLVDCLDPLQNLKHLQIDSSDLNEISSQTFTKKLSAITNLTITRNKFRTINQNAFSTLTELRSLEIIANGNLEILESGAFNGLHKLEYLIMYWNEKLTHLPRDVFHELESLIWLRLDHNKISTIDAEAFSGLSIKALTLSYNELTLIKNQTFSGLGTQMLYLSNNHIDVIEDGAFGNSEIHEVHLADNVNTSGDKLSWGLSNSTSVFY